MTISKAHWNTEGENVRLSMPFSKVDKEKRLVTGFASLDNLDKQNDIVTADASLKAFAKFRGNIREMHGPTAVGKMVSFKQDKYFDPESKKFYNGIVVTSYVSKGAQDTWEKVLDGTLSGFSIGGRMNKWDDALDAELGTPIRIIKEYDLVELSLVDNPANQFANVFSVEKVDGVDILKGDAANTIIENVFYDADAGIVLLSDNETELSPTSGEPMQNIGFVEKNDNEKTEMIKFLVDSAKGINTSKMNEEVDPMSKTTKKSVTAEVEETIEAVDTVVEKTEVAPEADAVVETPAADEAVQKEETAEEAKSEEVVVTEEVAKADESDVVAATEEVSKSDDVIAEAVTEIKNTLTSAFSDLVATVKSLQVEVESLKETSKADIATLNNNIQAVANEVNAAKDEFSEFGKRVDAVEADTAFRKSGDLGEIVQEQPAMVEKSLWGGRFLKATDLFN